MAFSWNKEKTSRKPAARNLALTALLGGAALAGIIGATGAGAAPNANGDLDTTFGEGGGIAFNFGGTEDMAYGMALQSGGKIVVAGEARLDAQHFTEFALTRLLPNGDIDTSFGAGGKVSTSFNEYFGSGARAVAVQGDDKIVAVGFGRNPDRAHDTFAIARYQANGALDTNFGDGGTALTPIDPQTGAGRNDIANALALAPGGKIVVAGVTGGFLADFGLARYNSDGSLDTTFGDNGVLITDIGGEDSGNAVAVQPDGKIVVAGTGWTSGSQQNFILVRYNNDGSLDTSFGSGGIASTDFRGGSDRAYGIVIRPDGKIVAGGTVQLSGGCSPNPCERYGFGIAQYNTNGTIDTSFGDAGKQSLDFLASSGAYALDRLSDGRLVLAGHYGADDFALTLFNADGSLDTSFGDAGLVRTTFGNDGDGINAVRVQPDGKILAAGKANTSATGTDYDFGVTRYLVTAGGPQPTSTPGSGPTATPTNVPGNGCDVPFSDVPVGSTFYDYVHCLSCQEILGGYSDGTFRPSNNVTRGQLAKIISNAAGFSEPVSGQTYSDVAPGSTFYEYVERMASRGIIGGYSDGTFRPTRFATRGQIAKIAANAAGFNEPVEGQTFIDVAPGSTFYEYVERMSSRNIIGGYSDGTFRPNNNATRGQTAKITSNTFFPNCEVKAGKK